MSSLEYANPYISQEFKTGKFVVQKTNNLFSAIPIYLDQAHEQFNAIVKDGGAIGLTEKPSALRRWTIAGPEVARIITEYENILSSKMGNNSHHEENIATQNQI